MKTLASLCVALAVWVSTASADTGVRLAPGDNPLQPLAASAGALKGLLDSSRFDMQHTVGISFGTGSSGFSQYYVNTMTYTPMEKLTVQASVGMQNLSSASGAFGQSVSGTRIVVPNVGVLYQPTPKLRIEFGFSNMPAYYGYGNPWGRSGF